MDRLESLTSFISRFFEQMKARITFTRINEREENEERSKAYHICKGMNYYQSNWVTMFTDEVSADLTCHNGGTVKKMAVLPKM